MIKLTTSEGDVQDTETADLSRRAFCIGTGAAFAGALTVGAAGTAAAAVINYSSEYSPDPTKSAPVVIEEHDADEMTSVLEYVADDGSTADLGDTGYAIATRDDDDEPFNPVSYRPDKLDTAEFVEFPRDETDTDADGEEIDVSWTDSSYWTASVGTISETSAASGADALELDGMDASATFNQFEIASGVRRKYAQAVVFVDAVAPSGEDPVSLTLDVADSSAGTSVSTSIDLEESTSYVVQKQLGDLDGAGELDTLDELTVEFTGGDATITIAALNLDRESDWSFGETEVLDTNDDGDEYVDTETVREPVGAVDLRDADDGPLSTVDDRLIETVTDLRVDVEQSISGLDDDAIELEFEEAERHTPDTRMRLVANLEAPTAYDLSWPDDVTLDDTVAHPGERHRTVEFVTGRDEYVTLDDVDDDDSELVWTDRTVDYDESGVDDELTLTSTISPGEITAVYYEILVTDDEQSDLEDTSLLAGPTGNDGGGGIFGTVMGILLSLAGAVGLRRFMNR